MKLHRAWTASLITAIAGALSMTGQGIGQGQDNTSALQGNPGGG